MPTNRDVRGVPALLRRLCGLGSCALALAGPAHGQTLPPGTQERIQAFLEGQVAPQLGRVEVHRMPFEPRAALSPCGRVEPSLPPGMRAWGRTTVILRCVDGANWSLTLPVRVSVIGPALVATEPLRGGTIPTASTLQLEEVELTHEAGTPVTDPAQLVGMTLTRPLASGQVLRQESLRATPTVVAGDPVRIQMAGAGFMIEADGQALGAAADGQTLRVRTEHGRILTGKLKGKTVEVRP